VDLMTLVRFLVSSGVDLTTTATTCTIFFAVRNVEDKKLVSPHFDSLDLVNPRDKTIKA
jgi:hypothetical protein